MHYYVLGIISVLFTFGQLILSRLRLPTNLTVINIWNYTCMIFTFLALLESFINSLAQRETSRNADHIDQQVISVYNLIYFSPIALVSSIETRLATLFVYCLKFDNIDNAFCIVHIL